MMEEAILPRFAEWNDMVCVDGSAKQADVERGYFASFDHAGEKWRVTRDTKVQAVMACHQWAQAHRGQVPFLIGTTKGGTTAKLMPAPGVDLPPDRHGLNIHGPLSARFIQR
jgi:hypothetical protein